jgi:hypothetical protein
MLEERLTRKQKDAKGTITTSKRKYLWEKYYQLDDYL